MTVLNAVLALLAFYLFAFLAFIKGGKNFISHTDHRYEHIVWASTGGIGDI